MRMLKKILKHTPGRLSLEINLNSPEVQDDNIKTITYYMKKLLIATTNKGKCEEIKSFLLDLPFEILSIDDLDDCPADPAETEATIEGNAILKARYYAEKTGMISLADDGGLFINALDGWPGVKSARMGETDEERRAVVCEKVAGLTEDKRDAQFRIALALYDPQSKNLHMTLGVRDGRMLTIGRAGLNNWGYNEIFYLPDLDKTYSELTKQEKNATSHRGLALNRMKYLLQNNYGAKHIIVPFSLVIQDGKILMQRRNDPHRPDYHNKWEFPGGSMEFNETLEENVIKETQEESGYDVEVITRLSHIGIENQETSNLPVQIYLIPYVCRVIGGDGVFNDAETLETRWFDLDDALNHDMIGENARMYKTILDELKEVIQKNNL